MKRLCASVSFCSLALLLLSLAGCGGDSSSQDASATVLFSGVVEDGPIENAKVSLRDSNEELLALCGPQGNVRCETATDATGAFSLQVPAGTVLTDLSVVAFGGRDRDTGVDFTGLEMRTPLALFTGDATTIVISPLTTLVAALRAQNLSLVDAKDRVRDWLALPTGTILTSRPSASLELQSRALLLSKIVLELNTVQPFARIGTEVVKPNTSLLAEDGTCDSAVLNALGLELNAQTRVADLQVLLTSASTIDDAASILKHKELMDIFAANIKMMLSDAVAFDEQNPNYQKNLKVLAETTLRAAAAGNEVITLGGTIPQRIARYILFTYQLRTWESLTLDPIAFAANLAPLENDHWVAELARSRSLYNVVSPLLLTELPGNDNQQRLAYFYGSDLSPHYQAEQLIGRVFDDAINDAVLLKIVEGKANAGLIDETQTIIATQIVQSEPKANAYRALADALIKYNRMEEAREELLRARDLYFKVINYKGMASASNTDTINLHETAASFRKAGYLDDAGTVLQYLSEVAQALIGSVATYGRLIVGTWNVADAYIAAGDLQAAVPVVDSLYGYAQVAPASLSGSVMTLKQRVFYLIETAKRYADLNNHNKVLQIYGEIQSLRSDDGYQNKTGIESWSWIPDLVESLYRVGETEEALALTKSIPASYVNTSGVTVSGLTFQTKAFKLVATYEALNGSLDAALVIVETSFPKPEDKVEALTYFASNKGAEYMAMALINAGRFDEACSALAKAELFLAGMTETTDANRYTYLVQRGYVKVADLYAMAGDPGKASELLQQAQVIVSGIVGNKEKVNGMVDIALGYQQIGHPEVAFDLLQNAVSRVDAIAESLATPEDAALLYETLIKAYEKTGDKSLVRTTVNLFLLKVQDIHTAGKVDDALASKECSYLLRASLYLEHAGFHDEAMIPLDDAKKLTKFNVVGDIIVGDVFAVTKTLITNYLNVISTYATVHEYEQSLSLALSWPLTTERNQAIQSLANATIDRDDFPDSAVANIDSDGDGKPDFFHPLVTADEIAASGLSLDDDSDGDGIKDTGDFRPLFAD